ncbi:MAG: hypothetical protein IT236_19105, partial [Bacteroidia bacterium]|nr:hypothetical protein [Bacteroidia bacterium]
MKFKLLFLLQFVILSALAQSPSLINYQGAARRADGTAISGKTIAIKFEFFQGTATTTPVFSESQSLLTSNLGLFSTQIGKVSNLNTVNWQGGNLFLQVSIDTTNGTNYVAMGMQQLVSVPYAMHAESVPSTYTNNILTIGQKSYTLTSGTSGNATITPSGIVTVTSSANSFTIDAPAVQYNPNTGILSQGNVTANITPTIGLTGNILTIGPSSNSITLPGSTVPNTSVTTTGGGATVTSPGTNTFNINVPATTLTGAGSATVSGAYPNFTINTPVSGTVPQTSITSTGIGTVTTAGTNSFNINVPQTNLAGTGAATVTGTFPNYTVNAPAATPSTNLSGAGSATVSGAFPNYTITTPAAIAQPQSTLTSTGIGTITSAGTNSFDINVPQTNLAGTGAATVTGTFPNYTVNAPAATPTTNLSGTGAATVTGTFPNYTVNAPAATATTNLSGAGSATVSGAFPNYTITT